MKRNLYLLSVGLVFCSCSEPEDVVTGHARVIMKSAPVQNVEPVPVSLPAPPEKTVSVTPAPEPIRETPSKPVIAQNQPVTTEPAAAPAAPAPEEKPVEIQSKPSPEPPAPAAEEKTATPFFSQQQKNAEVIETKPAPTPVQVTTPAPVPAPKPLAVIPARKVKPAVSQRQPATTSPGSYYRTPQTISPARRSYPIMPGQNRGLKNRYSN